VAVVGRRAEGGSPYGWVMKRVDEGFIPGGMLTSV